MHSEVTVVLGVHQDRYLLELELVEEVHRCHPRHLIPQLDQAEFRSRSQCSRFRFNNPSILSIFCPVV